MNNVIGFCLSLATSLTCLPNLQSFFYNAYQSHRAFFKNYPQDNSPMSGFKETELPKGLLQSGNNGQDLSERVPPPRSSSPVIGSPPVRVVPIGTPPKQPVSHTMNHQVNRKQHFIPLLSLFVVHYL